MSRSIPSEDDAIELRHVRAFVAVADSLSFSRAAAQLFVSQPALSRQVSGLERLLGCDVFVRSTRRVELTPAGERFYQCARTLLDDVDEAVATARQAGGVHERRATALWRPLSDVLSAPITDLHELREESERFHGQFAPPAETETRPVNAGGVPALALREAHEQPVTVLYLHGGGYIMGSAYGCRHVAGALSVATTRGVLVPDYRLAPEHPFPAALEDATNAYEWLVARAPDVADIVIVGESAGAGLAMTLLLTLRDAGLPLPARAVLLSPWLDLSCARLEDHESLAPYTVERLRSFAQAYVAGSDAACLRPLEADLRGLPAMLVQVGKDDALAIDAFALSERAQAQGADLELQLFDAEVHTFQVFWSFLPVAADALDRVGRFVAQ